ncbi:MAG TPA: four helix bundle protein [Verrucomicrobiae bacterium]|jgi:four helix bundle protein
MSEISTNKTAADPTVMFDHEKLDVYQFELRFIGWVTDLLEEVSTKPARRIAEVCDQLDRASLSSLLNTAEGNGKRQRQVRAKFFDDARGSAMECAACLDALVAKKILKDDRIYEGKTILVRIVSMLCGLVDRFDSPSDRVGEDPVEYRINTTEPHSRTRTKKRTRRSK